MNRVRPFCLTSFAVLQLEDSIGKIHRLMNEGIQLAQDERYSQAVERFSEALATASHGVALTPSAIVLRAAPAIVVRPCA